MIASSSPLTRALFTSALFTGGLVTSARAEVSDAVAHAPVLIHIRDSDPCFDQARFVRNLRARLPEKRVELTTENGHADVRVVRLEQGYQAELLLRSSDTTALHRTISALTCDEAADGIAFITSVALDEPPHDDRPHEPSAPEEGKLGIGQRSWEIRVAAGAQLAFAALPRTAAGPQLSVSAGQRRAGFWSPGVELGFIALPPVELREAAGVARFSLWELTLDLCPSQARLGPVWARPCAYGTAGQLRSEGKETENGQLRRRPYLTAGAELALGVDLGRWIDLIVRGSWSGALIVDSYQFNDEIFYEQSAFSYGLGAQLSVTVF